ncbi:MAG TPA: hypothetical protein PLD96_04660, partial [Methanothrix sp.]|nr:hypothetical protein [Methanothrix sp.]
HDYQYHGSVYGIIPAKRGLMHQSSLTVLGLEKQCLAFCGLKAMEAGGDYRFGSGNRDHLSRNDEAIWMVAALALAGAKNVAGKIKMRPGMRAHRKGRERVAFLAICSRQPLLKVRSITRKSRRATKWRTDIVHLI